MEMGLKETLEKVLLAVTFAEAGEFDTARPLMRKEKYVWNKFLQRWTDRAWRP
jgi:hypothetical protein